MSRMEFLEEAKGRLLGEGRQGPSKGRQQWEKEMYALIDKLKATGWPDVGFSSRAEKSAKREVRLEMGAMLRLIRRIKKELGWSR